MTWPRLLHHPEVDNRGSRGLLLVGVMLLKVAVPEGDYDGSLSQMIRS